MCEVPLLFYYVLYYREDLNRRLSLIHAMIIGAATYLSPWDGEQLMEGWCVDEFFQV